MTRIAVSTGGGDAPGLNACIEGVVRAAERRGFVSLGIRDGLDGLLCPERFSGCGVVELDGRAVERISAKGGTVLGAASGGDPLAAGVGRVVAELERHRVDVLVAVGGDGTQRIASVLSAAGVAVVGAPKTIDNDLVGTQSTFGFQSAVDEVARCLDGLRNTADAHSRVFVVEVMGRDAGWIALHGGFAGGADVILLPEFAYSSGCVLDVVSRRVQAGCRSTVVVVAEGAVECVNGAQVVGHNVNGSRRLGGAAEFVAAFLDGKVGAQVRCVNLGHLLRGPNPGATDRILGLTLGSAAVDAVVDGEFGVMVAWSGSGVERVPLAEVAGRIKQVSLSDPVLRAALAVGVEFCTAAPVRL
jgi:6-phosphofructokinase 1